MSDSGDQDTPPEVRLSDSTVTYLETKIEAAVARGITVGLSGFMTDETAEKFWGVGFQMLQQQATARTGRFVLDGMSTLLKKGIWIALLVGFLYAIGGWNLVKSAGALIAKAVATP